MKQIQRKEYLDELIALKDKKIIKIVTGVRRCGKSTLLEMMRNYLISEGIAEEQIVSINFEDYDNVSLREPAALYQYIKERMRPSRKTYIFLDEIQIVRDFPEVLDALYVKDETDLYVTGSNACMLSGEISTLISGRYVEISMLPFSFREFVEASDGTDLQISYRDYLTIGSFPYSLEVAGHAKAHHDYLMGIYNSIVLKDVVARYRISDVMMLESVIRFMFDNIGNVVSTKKIADTMTSFGRKVDVRTVEKFLTALSESYVLYKVGRYDVKGKQHLKTQEKYYVVDLGLRRVLLGNRYADVGHILENVVFLELKRRGYEVYIGKYENLEIDFVAMDDAGPMYVQVAASVRDRDTLEWELAPLKGLKDNYRKYILTLDMEPDTDHDGIIQRNALEWLLE